MLGPRLVHPCSDLPVAGCERDHVPSGALAVRFYIRGRALAGIKPGGMSARDANAAGMRPTMSIGNRAVGARCDLSTNPTCSISGLNLPSAPTIASTSAATAVNRFWAPALLVLARAL
jgi:hypothetical protein